MTSLKATIFLKLVRTCHCKGVVLWPANTAIKHGGCGALLRSAAKQSLDVFYRMIITGAVKYSALFHRLQPPPPSSSPSPQSGFTVY